MTHDNYIIFRFQYPLIKCYPNTSISICSCIVCGCFQATTPELSSFDRNCMDHNRNTFMIWPSTEKSLLASDLELYVIYNKYSAPSWPLMQFQRLF